MDLKGRVGRGGGRLINGKLVAKGEDVVFNENFGCRLHEIVPPRERIEHPAGDG